MVANIMYTDIISYALALRLKEAGVKMETTGFYNNLLMKGMPKKDYSMYVPAPTYAEVLDWFGDKGIWICVKGGFYSFDVFVYHDMESVYESFESFGQAIDKGVEEAIKIWIRTK